MISNELVSLLENAFTRGDYVICLLVKQAETESWSGHLSCLPAGRVDVHVHFYPHTWYSFPPLLLTTVHFQSSRSWPSVCC